MSEVTPSGIRGTMLDVSYVPAPDMTFDQYCYEVGMFVHFGKRWGWYLGDLLRYGEATFPDRYTQAIEFTGLEESTLRNAAWVAGVYPSEDRDMSLSFTHHMEVAGIAHREERLGWLAKARDEGWSTYQLRLARKGELPMGMEVPKINETNVSLVNETLKGMIQIFEDYKPSRSHENIFPTKWGHVKVEWVIGKSP